jgi:cobalt-zinc-cadmium efflux system membrane fusion protein
MQLHRKFFILSIGIVALIVISALYFFYAKTPPITAPKTDANIVELTGNQTALVKVEAVVKRQFFVQREAVGNIDFNENMSVAVFSPYQGKIITALANMGDEVKKGQVLFTIDSPDLIQAESALIAAAGVLDLTTKVLERDTAIYKTNSIAQKDLDQAISDHQTAEGSLKAARDAVRVFGKTEAEINTIIAKHKVDSSLIVRSPITGQVTARNAAPGLFVQPGTSPAPYSVADISSMWMVANVAENDSPFLHSGQTVKVKVAAYPERLFEGKISTIGATVDPNTHRVLIRAEIPDPSHILRSGMLANFTIQIGDPVASAALPLGGVVREGDGTMTVWVTTNSKRFEKRTVKLGIEQDGYDQILEGLQPNELIATDGALFLDNALTSTSE